MSMSGGKAACNIARKNAQKTGKSPDFFLPGTCRFNIVYFYLEYQFQWDSGTPGIPGIGTSCNLQSLRKLLSVFLQIGCRLFPGQANFFL